MQEHWDNAQEQRFNTLAVCRLAKLGTGLNNALIEQQVRPVGQHVLLLHLEHIPIIKPQPAALDKGA